MVCRPFKLPDGAVGIACGPRRRRKPRHVCGHLSSKLCDFPVGGGKTCDKPLCARCAVDVGLDLDYCPDHPR